MKITRNQLRQIIKEELNRLNENTPGKPIPLMDRVWLWPDLEDYTDEERRQEGIAMAMIAYIDILTTRSAGSDRDILRRVRGPEGVKNSSRRRFLMELLGTDNPNDIDDLGTHGISDLLREKGFDSYNGTDSDIVRRAAAAFDEDNADGALDRALKKDGVWRPNHYEGQGG